MGIVRDLYYARKMSAGLKLPAPTVALLIKRLRLAAAMGGGVTKTVSGAPAHITDALAKAALSVLATISPVQDLHGYSKPWAAGAGKNLYSPSWATPTGANSTVTVSGEEIHVVTTGGTTYSGMSSQSAHDLPAGTYYVKFKVKTGAVTGTGGICGLRKRSNNTFAATSSFSSGTLEYSFSGTTTEPCYFSVLGNGGSTGDSQASDFTLYDLIISTENVDYEPYENVCPITGMTSAKIYRFGKNLFNKNGVSPSAVTITQNSSGFRIVSNANGTYKVCYGGFQFQTLDFPDGTEVTFSAHCKVNSGKARIGIRRESDHNLVAYSSLVSSGEADLSLTYTYDKSIPVYLSMFCTWSESEAGDVEYTNVQLEIGSTVTSYEPYAGDTYTEDWTSVAGTVYGGTLDVVTGVLTVDRKLVTLTGADNWSLAGTSKFYCPIGGAEFQNSTSIDEQISNMYMFSGLVGGGSSDVTVDHSFYLQRVASNVSWCRAWVYDTDYTFEDFKAMLNNTPLQVTYPIVSTTYQLTPQEVQMLLGENNVWSSSGDTVSVTYYAEGNANPLQSLNILLGGNYSNPKTADDVSDKEALEIILGGNK